MKRRKTEKLEKRYEAGVCKLGRVYRRVKLLVVVGLCQAGGFWCQLIRV